MYYVESAPLGQLGGPLQKAGSFEQVEDALKLTRFLVQEWKKQGAVIRKRPGHNVWAVRVGTEYVDVIRIRSTGL